MIKETYYNQYKGWGEIIPSTAKIINVMRSNGSILAPSYSLLNDWKDKKISWEEYTRKFKQEMNENDNVLRFMKEIKEASKIGDIYFVCACHNKKKQCHRFILIEMINKIGE